MELQTISSFDRHLAAHLAVVNSLALRTGMLVGGKLNNWQILITAKCVVSVKNQ